MMKYRILMALGAMVAVLAACTDNSEGQKEEPSAPEFTFSIAEESFSVAVDSSVFFGAELVRGTDVKTTWSVDGELVARTPSVTWTFSKIGVSKVNFLAQNDLGKVEKEYAVTVTGIPLVVSYSVEYDAVQAVIGTPLEMSVTVESGDKSTVHSWKLDGVELSTGTAFTKTFTEEELGNHTLTYYGVNIDGLSATRTWAVSVVDLPLEVNFTPSGDNLNAMVGDNVKFGASIVHGASGAAYSWKVGGTQVSTDAAYTFACESTGSYAVSCAVTNAIGEKASREWTVTVAEKTERSFMVIDAEEMTALPGTDILKGNDNALSIVDNPCVSSVNPGTKVIKDDLSAASWATSGLIQVYLNHISSEERYKYHAVRIKVYLGVNDYLPFMVLTNNSKASRPTKVNGTDFYPGHSKDLWASLVKTDDWNVLEYNIVTGNYANVAETMADVTQVQFRLLVNYDNTNYPGSLSDTNTHIVYVDDIELVE